MSFTGESGFAAPPGATPELEHWFAQIAAQIDGVIDDQLSLPLSPTEGGTGLETYTTGDVLYADAPDSLAKRPIGSEGQILKVVGGVPDWAPSAGQTAEALTRTNDTNVTLTLTGTPASALLEAVDIAVGWNGTLGLDRLPHFEAGTANLGADADLPTAPETALIFANVDGFDAFAHPGADRFLKALAAGGYQWSSSVEDTRIPDSDYSGQVLIGGSGGAWAKAGWGVEAAGSADRRFLSYPGGDVDLTATWETLIEADLPSHSHAAENITSGTFGGATPGGGYEFTTTLTVDGVTGLVAGDIPALPASKITSGVFGPNRISHFDAGTTSLADDAGLPTAPEVAVVLANDSGFDVLANPGSDRFLKVNSVGDITWASVTGTVPDSDASGRLLIGDGTGGWVNSAWAVTSEEPVTAEFLRHPGGMNQTATWEPISSGDLPSHSHIAENITSGSFGGASPGGGYTFTTAVTMQSTLDVDGIFTVGDGSTNAFAIIDGAAGSFRDIQFRSGGTERWILRVDTTAEGGSNAGSDFVLQARNDAGSTLRTDLKIVRSTGAWTIPGAVTMQSTLDVTGVLTADGDIVSGSDSSRLIMGGGSTISINSGASVRVFGNSAASAGQFHYLAGNVAGGNHRWFTESADEKMRLTSAGHLALGTTDVEAWGANATAMQLGPQSALVNWDGADKETWFALNAYHDGTNFTYQVTDEAAMVRLLNGTIALRVAPSGTADTAISWTDALTVTNAGDLEMLSGKKLFFDGGGDSYIWERDGSPNDIRVSAGGSGYQFHPNRFVPVDNNARTLGLSNLRWSTIYGVDLDLTGTAKIVNDDAILTLEHPTSGATFGSWIRFRQSGTAKWSVGYHDSGNVFYISESDDIQTNPRFQIAQGGDVGIGAAPSNPGGFSAFLQLSAGSAAISLNETDGRDYIMASVNNEWRLRDQTAGSYRVVMDSSGNLFSRTSAATLGTATHRWNKIYADDIGQPGTRVSNIYADFLSTTGNAAIAGQGYSTLESRSTSGSNITLNYDNGNSQRVTLNGSGATITLGGASTNQKSGATYTVFITASGGSRTYSTSGVTVWVTSAPDGSLAQDNTVVITIMVVGSTVLGWATSDFNTPV